MNKTDYVYLIDPFKKDITLVHLPTGKLELETIYDLVQCATIDMYGLTHDTDLIIDDEGLFVEDQKVLCYRRQSICRPSVDRWRSQ